MADDETPRPVSPVWRRIVIAGAVAAGAIILLSGLVVAWFQHDATRSAVERHQRRMQPEHTDANIAPTTAVEVKVGVYVDRIVHVSFKDTSWEVEFYVWFDWPGDAASSPGKRLNVVDGQLESLNLVREQQHGERRYELYKARATITKAFDISRFPLDDHMLTIRLEDSERQHDKLRFTADASASSTSSRVRVPGYEVTRTDAVVKPHAYRTSRGDPHLAPTSVATYSQFIYGISIARPGWGLFFKLFLGLYIPVAVSMLVFFIKPTDIDARFGLSVGALFAVMANQYVITSSLPEGSDLALSDLINGLGILTILLTLAQSTASLHLAHRDEHALSRRFDRIAFVAVAVGFAIANIVMPLASRP